MSYYNGFYVVPITRINSCQPPNQMPYYNQEYGFTVYPTSNSQPDTYETRAENARRRNPSGDHRHNPGYNNIKNPNIYFVPKW